jgi:hypothetical protein
MTSPNTRETALKDLTAGVVDDTRGISGQYRGRRPPGSNENPIEKWFAGGEIR